MLDSIKEEICVEGRVYSHMYKPGDFIISDNLAVGHEADPATQLPREEVNLENPVSWKALELPLN